MEIEKLLNEIVVHRLYGEGVVKSIEGSYILVEFENTKKCKFLVPSCFDKFLQLKSDDMQQEIDQAVNEWKIKNGIYKSEQLHKKMRDMQKGIEERGVEREKKRIEKLIEDSKRIRFFAGLDAPANKSEDKEQQ